ncbi:MAG: DUF4097 domain-containing protein [Anaerolineae bacterium]|nr:DUF4097 domain-containing protein [Anaerolineae bacterium]
MGPEPIDQEPPQSTNVDAGWHNEAEPITGVPDSDLLPGEPVYGAPLGDARKKKKFSTLDRRGSGCNFPVILLGGCMVVCLVCCCLPLCASTVLFGSLAAIVSNSETAVTGAETVAVPAGATITLSINNPVGEITVERGRSGVVEVEYTKRAYDLSHSRAEQELDKIDVLVTQPGGDDTVDITVDTDRQRDDFFSFANNVSLTIRVPESVPSVHLVIESKVGTISVHDITAESLDIRANTGKVEFDGALVQQPAGPYRIETSTGAISVQLPRDVHVRIDAQTEVGDVDVRMQEFDAVDDYESTEDVLGESWVGTFGEGMEDPPTLTLRSDTGAVIVEAQ